MCGLAAAVLPSTIGEIQSSRALRNPTLLTGRRRAIGSAVRGAAGVLLLLVLLSAPRFLIPAIGSPQAREALQTAQGWGVTGLERMSATIDDLFNQFTLRYYDRRAPAEPEAAPAERSRVPGDADPGGGRKAIGLVRGIFPCHPEPRSGEGSQ